MTTASARPSHREPPTPDQLRIDLLLSGGLLVAAIISVWLGQVAGVYGADPQSNLTGGILYAVAVTLPLAVRRRWPNTVLIVVAIAFFVGGTLRIPEAYVGNIALFTAFYTVGAWDNDRRRALITRVIVTIGMFVWLLTSVFIEAANDDGEQIGLMSAFAAFMLIQVLVNVAYFGGAYVFGEHAYANALTNLALRNRSLELERERERTAAQAVALDRVRIARELHDVVAHHVSAMGVQAGAARTVLDRSPDAARTALASVETSAREALTELRQLLDTLRTPQADTPGESTVTWDAAEQLIAHANANGLPTTFTVVGTTRDLPDLVQVNLYRITQEALTNARRHGGPSATADVRVRYADDAVELEITNTGTVPAHTTPGLGLVGMRERAIAGGGTAEIGPRTRGGYLVRVRMPLEPVGATTGAAT